MAKDRSIDHRAERRTRVRIVISGLGVGHNFVFFFRRLRSRRLGARLRSSGRRFGRKQQSRSVGGTVIAGRNVSDLVGVLAIAMSQPGRS